MHSVGIRGEKGNFFSINIKEEKEQRGDICFEVMKGELYGQPRIEVKN